MKEQNISRRLTAYLLDVFFVYLVIVLITNIRFINPTYNKLLEVTENYNVVTESYNKEEISDDEYLGATRDYLYDVTRYNISTSIVTVVVLFAYFGLFQKYNNGQTLGKKIMKLRITGIDDKPLSLVNSLLRVIPMQYVLIGSVIPIILNVILVNILNKAIFSNVYSILVYGFIIINIISFGMMYIRKDKRGLHDLLAKSKVVVE